MRYSSIYEEHLPGLQVVARCCKHGEFEALVYGDAQAYLQASVILHGVRALRPIPRSLVGAENAAGPS